MANSLLSSTKQYASAISLWKFVLSFITLVECAPFFHFVPPSVHSFQHPKFKMAIQSALFTNIVLCIWYYNINISYYKQTSLLLCVFFCFSLFDMVFIIGLDLPPPLLSFPIRFPALSVHQQIQSLIIYFNDNYFIFYCFYSFIPLPTLI